MRFAPIDKWRHYAVRLALELIVVFIGVYAAFALAEHQAREEVSVRRGQIERALISEIRDITSNTRRVAEQLPLQLAVFDSAVEAGARPPLQPWIEPIRVQTHIWEATLQSGALELLDVETVVSLSEFYNELNAGFEQLEQLRTLSETILIPNLDEAPAEFYETNARRLRAKYRWYRDGLGRLASLATSITASGDSLAASFARRQ